MASLVASSSSQISPSLSVQEKGSRNKRKFRADPPLGEPNKVIPSPQNECLCYEFSAEKFEVAPDHKEVNACGLCRFNQDHSDGLKIDVGLSSPLDLGSPNAEPSQPKEELEADEFHDADWSNLTEDQLKELVLSNLNAIFRSAIKRILACGYTEGVVMKSILRPGICYGCKDVVSNIVNNTLAFLRNDREIDPSREHCFKDLLQLEKYILAELVCVLREVRPFFSTGDAMWYLLICDMNVSHACAMNGEPSSNFLSDGAANACSYIQTDSQSKLETKAPGLNLPNPSYSIFSESHNFPSEAPFVAGVPDLKDLKNSQIPGRLSEKEGADSRSNSIDKAFSTTGTSQSSMGEGKFGSIRQVHSVSTKRDYIFRQQSIGNRTYGSKGSSRGGKLSGFMLDRKLKSVSDSTTIKLKSASLKIGKAVGVNVSRDNLYPNLSPIAGPSTPTVFAVDSPDTISRSPKPNTLISPHATNILPVLSGPTTLSDTYSNDLSLLFSSKSKSFQMPDTCNTKAFNSSCMGKLIDKSQLEHPPQDRKDEMILKLFPRVQELQNQLQEWTEWANQKVMQAASRLSKDKDELKSLRQEKEEVERLKREKQTLEENTMKKLSEMENALRKASGQVERANAAVRKLEVENAALSREMEDAKLHAAESAASCQEVSMREKKTQMKFQSWEKQKSLFLEELMTEKHKLEQLLQELEQAKVQQEQVEARWKQESKEKEDILLEVSSIRKEREQIEVSEKSKEDLIKSKAAKNLQRYRDDIQKLEKEIAQLRQKTDSSKIAALRSGINGSYASRCMDMKHKHGSNTSTNSVVGGVKRERECVMCLSEEMTVVFLPCAHQVVCTTCNKLHENQGMKDCPSCRTPIQHRISVRFSLS